MVRVIDRIHHMTGIRLPKWDFAQLESKLSAFDLLVDSHYRYYQFHSNMLVAVASSFFLQVLASHGRSTVACFVGVALIEAVLWVGSRDTLQKYVERTGALLKQTHGMSAKLVRSEKPDGNGGRNRK